MQHRPVAGQGLAPPLRAQAERLGPQARERAVGRQAVRVEEVGRGAAAARELAQAQHLAVADVEVEGGGARGPGRGRPGGDPQAARLHQVHDQREVAVRGHADHLPAPPDRHDLAAGERLQRRRDAADGGRVVDPDALHDAPPEGPVEPLRQGLQLGQLRHGPRPGPSL